VALKKGILIVFEGIDGSGKSVQARLLQEKLREKGFDVVSFQEPSGSKWGREIKKKALYPDSLSPEEELDLFVKDRRENVEKNLKPALQKKKVVILDRYYFSTISYQGARGIDPDRIRKINEQFAPQADLVFILDIDARSGLDRIKDRKNKERLFEREDYLARVDQIFRSLKGKNFIHLDALETEGEISRKIEEVALDYLRKHLNTGSGFQKFQ
jgi:dTMP kinase